MCDRAKQTHQIAEASQARNDQLRAAFGLSEFYKDGTSLDPQRKDKERAAEALAAAQKTYTYVVPVLVLMCLHMLASRGRSGMEHSTRLGHSSVSRLVSFCTAMKTYLFSRTFFDTDNTRDSFYPRDAMLARVIEIAKCLSVRPSVRPSRAGIVSKQRKQAA